MTVRRWNFKTREYEPYEIPDDWKIKTFCVDMDEIINCPHCGRELAFGDSYTSREIHTKHGIGYSVCAECYAKEWERERLSNGKG